jgi:hypothetical protein
VVLLNHLHQGLAKVTHQGATNAAGVHFGDVNASVLQEAAVDANLTKFVLNEYQIFALIGFLDHFLNEGGLTGAKEAGVYINFGHKITFFQ